MKNSLFVNLANIICISMQTVCKFLKLQKKVVETLLDIDIKFYSFHLNRLYIDY